jgi:hypothetical protein
VAKEYPISSLFPVSLLNFRTVSLDYMPPAAP